MRRRDLEKVELTANHVGIRAVLRHMCAQSLKAVYTPGLQTIFAKIFLIHRFLERASDLVYLATVSLAAPALSGDNTQSIIAFFLHIHPLFLAFPRLRERLETQRKKGKGE